LADLIGSQVVGPDGEIGQVVEVRIFPTIDALVIERPDGVRVELPLNPHWVAEVNLEERRIVLSSTDGIIE
jgi:ribosomal 30S subunit maturation factor RimM